MSNETELINVISEKLEDLIISGFIVEVSPVEADIMGEYLKMDLTKKTRCRY